MTHTPPEQARLQARTLLEVDGAGPTESDRFAEAVRTLFATRAVLGGGDVPLEGTYRQSGQAVHTTNSADQPDSFDLENPAGWLWTLAVPAPDETIDDEGVARAARNVGETAVRLKQEPAADVIQTTHQGPYADEGPSLAALQQAAAARGLLIVGPHTEVYLDDPRSTEPEALRTVLRYPVT